MKEKRVENELPAPAGMSSKMHLSYKTVRWLGGIQKQAASADLTGLLCTTLQQIERFVKKPCPTV